MSRSPGGGPRPPRMSGAPPASPRRGGRLTPSSNIGEVAAQLRAPASNESCARRRPTPPSNEGCARPAPFGLVVCVCVCVVVVCFLRGRGRGRRNTEREGSTPVTPTHPEQHPPAVLNALLPPGPEFRVPSPRGFTEAKESGQNEKKGQRRRGGRSRTRDPPTYSSPSPPHLPGRSCWLFWCLSDYKQEAEATQKQTRRAQRSQDAPGATPAPRFASCASQRGGMRRPAGLAGEPAQR